MHYFRILIGLRGCYADSSENEIHACADPAALCEVINERAAWYADSDESTGPQFDPCTPEEAAAIFATYTSPKAPGLPVAAATWNNGAWGALVSGATESEYAESQLAESDDFTAESGNVYFWAPACLTPWLEYGAESECPEGEAYEKQARAAYDIPESAAHKLMSCSMESGESGFMRLHDFTMPEGLAYAGPAAVCVYVPGLPD